MTRTSRRKQKQRRLLFLALGLVLILALAIPGCKKEPPIAVTPDGGTDTGTVPIKPSPDPVPPLTPQPDLPGAIIASIDNKSEARPQSGLDKADMVIEVIAEGGITRYMAFFYSKKAAVVGPIRSARYYFAQIAKPYNTPLAHAGGSSKALQMITDLKIPDLDEIYNAQQAFWRDKSRVAPHNLYTSTDRLLEQAQRKGLRMSPLPKLPQGDMPQSAASESIDITYSPYYKVTWQWQEARYVRSINNKLHTMKDGAKLVADNVVIISAAHHDVVTDVLRTDIDIIGNGEAVFLRDGQKYIGTWKKASAYDHFEFMVQSQPFKFTKGNTWVQIVPSMDVVVIQ